VLPDPLGIPGPPVDDLQRVAEMLGGRPVDEDGADVLDLVSRNPPQRSTMLGLPNDAASSGVSPKSS
jgi:hypothetical protein